MNLDQLEYKEEHHTMRWSIHKKGKVDELCFKAPKNVQDGIYSVEVIGLRKPFGHYEHRRYYAEVIIVKDGRFVPQPTMEAIFYAQAQAEGGVTRFDHVFIERLSYSAKHGLFKASLGS